MSQSSAILLARVCLTVLVTIMPAWGGTITGVVPLPEKDGTRVAVEKYRGKISGNIAAPPPVLAGVWLEAKGLDAPANPPQVDLGQENYQFARSLLVVPRGTLVVFPNKDPDYHNIFSLSRTKRFDLGRYKRSEDPAPSVLFDKAGFVALRCEIHDHMKADIIVVESPYFTTSDGKGSFTLPNVPAGSYTLHARVDAKTSWTIPVVVRGSETVKIEFNQP